MFRLTACSNGLQLVTFQSKKEKRKEISLIFTCEPGKSRHRHPPPMYYFLSLLILSVSFLLLPFLTLQLSLALYRSSLPVPIHPL